MSHIRLNEKGAWEKNPNGRYPSYHYIEGGIIKIDDRYYRVEDVAEGTNRINVTNIGDSSKQYVFFVKKDPLYDRYNSTIEFIDYREEFLFQDGEWKQTLSDRPHGGYSRPVEIDGEECQIERIFPGTNRAIVRTSTHQVEVSFLSDGRVLFPSKGKPSIGSFIKIKGKIEKIVGIRDGIYPYTVESVDTGWKEEDLRSSIKQWEEGYCPQGKRFAIYSEDNLKSMEMMEIKETNLFYKKDEDNDKKGLAFELKSASLRIAALQTNRILKRILLKILSDGGFSKKDNGVVERLLSSPLGSAILSQLAGQLFDSLPEDYRVEELGEEMRLLAYSTVGNDLIDSLLLNREMIRFDVKVSKSSEEPVLPEGFEGEDCQMPTIKERKA